MPRVREADLRGGRFESEVRMVELQSPDLWNNRKALGFCRRCGKAFEERSRTCPRCDKKDQMGYITHLSNEEAERSRRRQFGR